MPAGVTALVLLGLLSGGCVWEQEVELGEIDDDLMAEGGLGIRYWCDGGVGEVEPAEVSEPAAGFFRRTNGSGIILANDCYEICLKPWVDQFAECVEAGLPLGVCAIRGQDGVNFCEQSCGVKRGWALLAECECEQACDEDSAYFALGCFAQVQTVDVCHQARDQMSLYCSRRCSMALPRG